MWSLLSALPILTSLLQSNITINNFIPSYEQLLRLIENANNLKEVNGDKLFKGFKNKVSLKQVTFSYNKNQLTLNK